jgi:hypothetical protein
MGAAIQRVKFLSLKLKASMQDFAFHALHWGFEWAIGIALNLIDFGFIENGGIELHGFFGLFIKPEEGSNFLHDVLLLS